MRCINCQNKNSPALHVILIEYTIEYYYEIQHKNVCI